MKSRNKIKFSIIVATLNRGSDLNDFLNCLHNIKILNNPIIEVIIVDNNCSEEKTKETIELCKYFNVRFTHEPKQGKPYAVNKGINIARGKYLVFTDDDVLIKDRYWLAKMVNHFKIHPKLGYVSGNVIACKQESESEIVWEKKGGLSKGKKEKYWSTNYLTKFIFRFVPWQFNKICAGANCMIPKKIVDEIKGYNILLETDAIKHGTTLEIGYKIAKAGYELLYTPNSVVYHKHPTSVEKLIHKMYIYGTGDTAYQMLMFLQYGDWRCFWWALLGHPFYTIYYKFIPSLFGKYIFPPKYILSGLLGNLVGPYVLVFDYFLKGGRFGYHHYYSNLNNV